MLELEDSVDTRLYRSEIEALHRLHELQAQTDEDLPVTVGFY